MDIPNVDTHDYEKAQATIRLMNELEKDGFLVKKKDITLLKKWNKT